MRPALRPRRPATALALGNVLTLAALAAAQPPTAQHAPGPNDQDTGDRAMWIPNLGQWSFPAHWVLRSGAVTMFVEQRGWRIELAVPEPPAATAAHADGPHRWRQSVDRPERRRGVALRMSFVGGHDAPVLGGEGETSARFAYFLGNDPAHWRAEVRPHRAVRFTEAWPGVDVRLRESDGHPEYDLLLAPRADLSRVVLRVEGADGLRIAKDGSLRIATPWGELLQPAPTTWQTNADGEIHGVNCRYAVLGPDRFGFEVDAWDRSMSLCIDPGLLWSTVIPGAVVSAAAPSHARAVDVGSDGRIVIGGVTQEPRYPTTLGAYDTTAAGAEAFVTVLDPNLSGAQQLVYSTFLGGNRSEGVVDLRVSDSGVITVLGVTDSIQFPTTPGAYDSTHNGRSDVWIARLDPAQSGAAQLVYSTLIGGAKGDQVGAMFVDDNGVITVGGDTASARFPTTSNAFRREHLGGTPLFPYDSFVLRLDPSLVGSAQLTYSTLIAGTSWETLLDVEVDQSGVITCVGETASADMPMTAGSFDDTYNGNGDGFLVRLDPSLVGVQQNVYSTYLGGSDSDWIETVAIAESGVITVAGDTQSLDFPTTADAYDSTPGGTRYDIFFTSFDLNQIGGGQLRYSSYFGGTDNDHVDTVRVSRAGIVTFAGHTSTADYPTTPGAWSETYSGGPTDAIVGRIDFTRVGSSQLIYSTFLGGSAGATGGDEISDLHVDGLGRAVVAGITHSDDFPTTPDAFASPGIGNSDAFAALLDLLPTGVTAFGTASAGCGGPLVASVTVMPSLGNSAFGITCTEAPDNGLGTIVFAESKLPVGLPLLGIELWIDLASPNTQLPIRANGVGFADVPLPIPNTPALAGASLFAQFLWIGPSAPSPCPPTGLSASHALQIDIQL